MKHSGIMTLGVMAVLLCIGVPLDAQAGPAADSDRMPYVEMASIAQRFSVILSPHVRVIPLMSANPTRAGQKPDLYFTIHATGGDIRVPIASDGSFAFPIRQDLIQENPPVSLHGAEEGGSFSIAAQFLKTASKEKEKIPYSEVMMPYTYAMQMFREAKLRHPEKPAPERLAALWLVVITPSDPLVIESKRGAIKIEPSADGKFRVPYDEGLLAEDPMVVFPTNTVRMGSFEFERPADPADGDKKSADSEPSSAGASPGPTPRS